jgi:hypothetical protein
MNKSTIGIMTALICFLILGPFGAVNWDAHGDMAQWSAGVKEALSKGAPLEALELLDKTRLTVWDACPLTAVKSLLVTKKAAGFGIYEERPNNRYKSGAPVLLYVQPIGYKHNKKGNVYEFGLTADFTFLNADGDVLAGKRGFGNWVMTSHERNTEFFMNLTYTLSGVKPGNYVIETVLNDKFSDKTTKIKTPVVID